MCDLKSDEAVKERLGCLPPKLEDLYQEILVKIDHYPATADREYARHTFAWLLCAQQQLSSRKVLVAVSMAMPQSRLVTTNEILDFCCNLVVLDSELDTFRFAHLSVREFLETQEAYTKMKCNALAGQSCLVTILNDARDGPSRALLSRLNHVDQGVLQLLDYANKYWAAHCRDAGDERRHGMLQELLSFFMHPESARASAIYRWNASLRHILRSEHYLLAVLCDCITTQAPEIIVACVFNLHEFVETYAEWIDTNAPTNDDGETCQYLAAKWGSCEALSILLDSKIYSVEPDVLQAASSTREGDCLALLLSERGCEIAITEGMVLEAARWNPDSLALLLNERGDEIVITEDVVKAAAFNEKSLALLLDRRGDEVVITKDVVSAAAYNAESLALLLNQRGDKVVITKDVVKTAIYNAESLALLLNQRGDEVVITEDVVKAAARSNANCLALLLDRRGDEVVITEDVVAAAIENEESLALLLDRRRDEVVITEDVIIAESKNLWREGDGIVENILLSGYLPFFSS